VLRVWPWEADRACRPSVILITAPLPCQAQPAQRYLTQPRLPGLRGGKEAPGVEKEGVTGRCLAIAAGCQRPLKEGKRLGSRNQRLLNCKERGKLRDASGLLPGG
jgi:hypothetical protein